MKFVKICPVCGKKNQPNAITCDESLTDLSMVPVTREEEASEPNLPKKKVFLELIGPDNSIIAIIKESTTLGREGVGNEYFKDHLTISRRHAKVEYFPENGEWRIIDEKSKNGTYIDGNKIEKNTWVTLQDGAELSLGKDGYKVKVSYKDE